MGWTRKDVSIVFCASLILLLLVLLAGEAGLAMLRPAPIQRDAVLGWMLKKDYHRDFTQKTLGGDPYPVSFTTDDRGLRTFGSPQAPVRILVLGDSFTADPYASNDRMWYVAMVQRLARHSRRPQSDFHVIAGGAGGWGTYQQLLLSQRMAVQKPDIVVLQFCSNDFENNSYVWESKGVVRGQFMRRPFAGTDLDHPRYAPGFWGAIYRSIIGESRLFNRVDGLIGSMQFRRYGGYTQPLPPGELAKLERNSVALTQEILVRLRAIYRDSSAVMVNCDGKTQDPNGQWQALARRAGFVPLSGPSDFLQSLPAERRKDVFFADGSHLSDEGNQLYGTIAGDQLAAIGLTLPD